MLRFGVSRNEEVSMVLAMNGRVVAVGLARLVRYQAGFIFRRAYLSANTTNEPTGRPYLNKNHL